MEKVKNKNILNQLQSYTKIMEEEHKILSRVIIEVAGKPKEYIEKTIRLVINQIKEKDEFKVEREKVFEAKEKENIWSTYTELELSTKDIPTLIGFCFDYMPSSVEVISPKSLSFDTNSMGNVLNDLATRLHQIDMVTKNIRAEKAVIEKNGTMLLKNAVLISVKKKEKALKEISSLIGIKEEQLKPFVDNLVKEGKIIENNNKYIAKK